MSNGSKRQLGSQEVGLGCGSLILIALIVWFFTAASTDDLEEKVQLLGERLDRIESKLDVMEKALERIESK